MATRKSVAATAKLNARKGGAPPKEHQFKPGKSGNPKGRPRKDESLKSVLREVLDEEVEAFEGGRPVKISCRRALAKRMVRKAVETGDPRLIRLLVEFDGPEPMVQPSTELRAQQDAQACAAVLAAFMPTTPPETPAGIGAQPAGTTAAEAAQSRDADEQLCLPFPEDP